MEQKRSSPQNHSNPPFIDSAGVHETFNEVPCWQIKVLNYVFSVRLNEEIPLYHYNPKSTILIMQQTPSAIMIAQIENKIGTSVSHPIPITDYDYHCTCGINFSLRHTSKIIEVEKVKYPECDSSKNVTYTPKLKPRLLRNPSPP